MYDPGETDVDCGGVCGATCEDGEQCAEDDDCVSNYCDHETKTCTTPSCDDEMQNGDESDIDCGGSCGANCQEGQRCDDDGDCASQICDPDALVCVTPDQCDNGVLDEGETGVDCGGVCGATCMNGELCDDDGDCKSGYCDVDTMTCENPTCEDGVENGNETDADCVCVAAECKAAPEDNMCQSCIKAGCCDAVVECLKDAKCTCWLECVAHNNDFEPCKFACGIKGNPGQITACANNECNSLNACALPDV